MIIYDTTHSRAINVSDLVSAQVIVSQHYTAVEVKTHHLKYRLELPENDCWDLFWEIINGFESKKVKYIGTIREE